MIKRILYSTGSVWVSEEEEIKEGDWYWDELVSSWDKVGPLQMIGLADGNSTKLIIQSSVGTTSPISCSKKIIAQTNLTLDGIPYIELPEEEKPEWNKAKELADEFANELTAEQGDWETAGRIKGRIEGVIHGIANYYKAASKDKKYSEEDLMSAFSCGRTYEKSNHQGVGQLELIPYIQSLTPKSNDDIIGCELVMENAVVWYDTMETKEIIKTYINKAGQTCLEVKQWIRK